MYLFQNGPTSNCLKKVVFTGKCFQTFNPLLHTRTWVQRENYATFEETLALNFWKFDINDGIMERSLFGINSNK